MGINGGLFEVLKEREGGDRKGKIRKEGRWMLEDGKVGEGCGKEWWGGGGIGVDRALGEEEREGWVFFLLWRIDY